MSYAQCCHFFQLAAKELQNLHQGKLSKQGFHYLHRDIRVDNFAIEIDTDNNISRVNLIDYGFAVKISSAKAEYHSQCFPLWNF